MTEVRGVRRLCYHLVAFSKATFIFFHVPQLTASLAHTYRCVIWFVACLDKIHDRSPLLVIIDKAWATGLGIERHDSRSTLIVDVRFHCCIIIFKLYLLSRTDTCQAVNCLPWLVTNPSSFNRLAISLRLRS